MKLKNTLTLSIIIPFADESELTREWCLNDLKGISSEVIIAKDWATGYAMSEGEFVCFLEPDCVFSPGYFRELIGLFDINPSFRKLAMITPVLAVNDWKKQVYGYRLATNGILPISKQSSSEVYLIQLGYIPGAIIRRSALSSLAPTYLADILTQSIKLSIYFWNNGQRVALNPRVVYVTTNEDLNQPLLMEHVIDLAPLMDMWRRELIG